jgi:hypothetical protein
MTRRGVCWAHATQGIDAILPKGGYEIQQKIDAIQISPTESIFKKAINLLSNDECSAYLKAIRDLKFSQLNPFLETVHSIHIRMNSEKWELSECSCSNWLKNYKCSHMIATAVRLQLTTWNPIFLDLPLEKKKKKGARKKNKSALIRQSIDVCASVAPRLIEISTEDDFAMFLLTKERQTK